MSIENKKYGKFSYDNFARSCDDNDLIRQTMRTINGVPVSNEQINMIKNTLLQYLGLHHDDILLELACGNGLISDGLFNACKEYVGVDISEYLIYIAKKNFENKPRITFYEDDITRFIKADKDFGKYTKVLCYAGIQYLSDIEVIQLLESLSITYKNVEIIVIGNIPDRNLANKFYVDKLKTADELNDICTAIGKWRAHDEFIKLVDESVWDIEIHRMPDSFYASHYRYDIVLKRKIRVIS